MPCEHSNYTTSPAHPVLGCVAASGINAAGGTIINTAQSFDPVAAASLLYENTYRLANMGSDFYSLVEPYYKAPTIPDKTGYHMYSYSLDFFNLDPMGSTNYGKLTNVSLYVNPSQAAVSAASAASLLVPAAGQFNANYLRERQFVRSNGLLRGWCILSLILFQDNQCFRGLKYGGGGTGHSLRHLLCSAIFRVCCNSSEQQHRPY